MARPLPPRRRPTDWTNALFELPYLIVFVAMIVVPLARSEEHTSELQSLMRISYAVLCLQKTAPPAHSPHIHTTQITSAHISGQQSPFYCAAHRQQTARERKQYRHK